MRKKNQKEDEEGIKVNDEEVDKENSTMEVDDLNESLVERSRRWDEKIRKKKQKEDEEEKKRNKIIIEKENHEKLKKQNAEKQLKKEKKVEMKMKNE